MITLNYDITTGVVKFAATTVIKRYGDVPCQVIFSAAPGTVSSIKLSLGSDAASPAILVYTDTWTQESDTTWTAQLDATDTRLAAYMSGMQSAQVDLELIVTIDGEAQYSPNLSLTVQQPIVTGATSSDGGPTYYTEAETDSEISAAVAAAVTALQARTVLKRLTADAPDIVSNTTPSMALAGGVLQWAVGAGETWAFTATVWTHADSNAPGISFGIFSTETVADSMIVLGDNSVTVFGIFGATQWAPNVVGDVIGLNGSGTVDIVLEISGSVKMGATGGVVGLALAAQGMTTDAVRAKRGSFLLAQKQ